MLEGVDELYKKSPRRSHKRTRDVIVPIFPIHQTEIFETIRKHNHTVIRRSDPPRILICGLPYLGLKEIRHGIRPGTTTVMFRDIAVISLVFHRCGGRCDVCRPRPPVAPFVFFLICISSLYNRNRARRPVLCLKTSKTPFHRLDRTIFHFPYSHPLN